MKNLFFLMLVNIISWNSVRAQTNLILNPSFEDTIGCPQGGGNIWWAKHWDSPLPQDICSCELFHRCSNFWDAINLQEPRTGDAIAGFCLFDGGGWREYAEVELTNSLEKGQLYCVSFYVSLSNFAAVAIENIQTTFSTEFIRSSSCSRLSLIPQTSYTSGVITDTVNWVNISGSFIAKGGERFMVIGDFNSFDSTNFLNLHPGYPIGASYYFLDDFAVYKCGSTIYPANAGPDIDLCLGDSVQLGTTDFKDYLYSWTGNDGSYYKTGMPWVKPRVTTTYILKQKDFKFDESISSVTVYVEECENELTVPNVFTPNGDGFNDKLEIVNKKGFHYIINIFDRWGRKVFTGNQDKLWEGSSDLIPGLTNNQFVAAGVYFYTLEATTREGNTLRYSGAIQLVR